MYIDYSGILCDTILELRVLRDKSLNGNTILSSGFMCRCKKIILNHYITSASNTMVSLIELIQTINNYPNETYIYDKFEKIKHRFSNEIYTNLHIHNEVNTKFVLLYEFTYKMIEQIMFDNIYTLIIHIYNNLEKSEELSEDILDIIYELTENAVFYLSGLRINCNNIKNTILTDDCKENSYICPICELTDNIQCSSVNNESECLYLILIPQLIDTLWFDNLIDILCKYHTNPKNIKLFLDYNLIEPFIWNDINELRYNKLLSLFNEVYLVNCPHIDFKSMYENKNIIKQPNLNMCIKN